jgi:hypothetical protein
MGQSNIAAGATIGSNHNSRSADGEIVAGRGFWPGLCVSLKHNSKFASFTIIAKGDFPSELNIPIPFSLVSNDVTNNRLLIMPAYWFMYNMYALARNASKYKDRDKRTQKTQHIEYDYLAPDTINEIFDALDLFKKLVPNEKGEATVTGWENTNRPTVITKLPQSTAVFREVIQLYGCRNLLKHIASAKPADFDSFKKTLSAKISRSKWLNIGGQLIAEEKMQQMKRSVKSGKIKSWDDIHHFYESMGNQYENDKLSHAYTSLLEVLDITSKQFTATLFKDILLKTMSTNDWMTNGIYEAREKDYSNPYRKMVYENNEEMIKVIGRLEDNSFIQEQMKKSDLFKKEVRSLIKKWKL